MAGSKDHTLNRYADVRRSKLDLRNQSIVLDTDCNVAEYGVAVPADVLAAHGLAAQATGPDEAAADATTIVTADGESFRLTAGGAGSGAAGEQLRIEGASVVDADLMPEMECVLRPGVIGTIADVRHEVGLYQDLGAASHSSPVKYAAVIFETTRNVAADGDRLLLAVAGTDYRAFSLDFDAGPAAEFTDETTDAQDAGDADVDVGVVAAKALNDGLVITNPRIFDAVVYHLGAGEAGGAATYVWSYWSGAAWVDFTPHGTAPAFTVAAQGRNVLQIPAAAKAAMGRLEATDVIGNVDDVSDLPGASCVGHFAVKVRISVVVGTTAPDIDHISVEEQADLGVALVDGQEHHIRLRIGGGGGGINVNDTPSAEFAVQAKVDDGGWATVGGPGVFAAGDTFRVAAKCHSLAGADKTLDIDALRCFQARRGV